MTAPGKNDVLAIWQESSHYWNKHNKTIEQMFAPLTQALINSAGISPGQSVLDVGGGSGQPSLSIAGIVGNTGLVAYTDPAQGMVKTAREEAERRQISNIKFYQAPAEHLPFPDNHFDAAVSRLSVMFFTDVSAGLKEILRVVKPGATVCLLVWSSTENNPFFSGVTKVLDRFVAPEPEDEDAPGAFRFAQPAKLAKLLREVGATEVQEVQVPFEIAAPLSAEQFWELRTEMSDTLRGKLKQLSPKQISMLKNETLKAVAKFFSVDGMNFPGQTLIVKGRKPF